MSNDGVLVEVRHVSQIYSSGRRPFTAIQDVTMTISEGEFVALLGPSGCGKSTLLRIITGLQAPSEGHVFYRGRLLQGVNPNASIVFQTFALFPWLTVQENVEVALKARGLPPALRTARAIDLLDRVGMDGFETAYPRELSGGMRQKVGFARAMAVEPELLCLDEPFSALDVLSAEALRGELLELWTGGSIPTRTILMVTHNIEEAVLMADRIVAMDKEPGRIAAELRVPMPHPRDRSDPAFMAIVDRVYGILAGRTEAEAVELGTAPGEPGLTRALPHITVNELLGLLGYLADEPDNRADIYRVSQELSLDSDLILRLSEAAERLGFAVVSEGDISLTPLGETFADARILARKEIFASRARRLPLVKWLLGLLAAAEGHRLSRGFVLLALELEFPPEQAEEQLDTVIDWGRYSELLAYDDDDEMIYREPSGVPA
ncbi:MAG: ABC transporter ATP-binding protein [Anaerolineae bacterium]